MAEAAAVHTKKQDYTGQERRKQPISAKKLTARHKQTLDELGKDALTRMYMKMYQIRNFEQRCEQSYQQQKIGGFLHLYIGQEALGVGMTSAIGSDDVVRRMSGH